MMIPVTPTRRLAGVVLLTAPVWVLAAYGFGVAPLIVGLAIVVGCLVDIAMTPGWRAIAVDRDLVGTVGIGDAVGARYVLRSSWPLRVVGAVYDALPPAVERAGTGPIPFAIAPRGETAIPVSLTGRTRGDFALGPLVLRVRGPLGWIDRSLRYRLGGGSSDGDPIDRGSPAVRVADAADAVAGDGGTGVAPPGRGDGVRGIARLHGGG